MVDNLIFPKADAAKPINPDAMPAFWVGEERPTSIHASEYVLQQVGVALDVNGEDRKFSADRPIQEIVLLRAMYHGGDIVIRPGWAPGLSRYKGFTRDQIETYINWVRGEYVVVGEKTQRILFDEIYRTPREFVRMMKQVWSAWQALIESKRPEILPQLEERAADEFRRKIGGRASEVPRPWEFEMAFNASLNPRDIEEVIAITSPKRDLMDELGLDDVAADALAVKAPVERRGGPPVIPDAPKVEVIPPKEGEEPEQRAPNGRLTIDTGELGLDDEAPTLQDHLVAAGFEREVAMDLSSLAHDHPRGIPPAVLGKIPAFKAKKARDSALAAIRQFQAKVPVQA